MSSPIVESSQAATGTVARPVRIQFTYWQGVGRRLTRDPISMVCAGILVLLILAAIFAPLIAPMDPYKSSILNRLKPFGTPGYLLGTDELGRDMLSRLIYGGRISLLMGLLPITVATFCGSILGIVAGFFGGKTNMVIMRITDVFFAFPSVLLAVGIAGALGAGPVNVLVSLSLVFTPPITRVAEAATIQIRNQDFIEAGARYRRVRAAHYRRSRPDQRNKPDTHLCVQPDRRFHRPRRRIVLPGVWSCAANGRLGTYVEYAASVDLPCAGYLYHAWNIDPDRLHLFQSAERWFADVHGSETMNDEAAETAQRTEFFTGQQDHGAEDRRALDVQDLTKHFRLRGGPIGGKRAYVQAVDRISFSVSRGETLGIVGESGCGKSTTARLLMRLIEPDEGRMLLDGQAVGGAHGISIRKLRHQVQMVFQDSYASLNPRHTATEEVSFGLIAQGVARSEAQRRANDMLDLVGLEPGVFADRYPHELSGGQRQRVNVARALYHRAECLTHVGDSQAVRSLTQCGEPMRFAMAAPIDLRNDFDSVSLRRLAKRTRDATQSRRLLALAEVYDGGSRTDASRIGGVGLQIIRDWVLRFNARGPDGLVDGKSPGAPSKLNADHRRALAEVVEAGPVPAVDGVVRWRRKDLARWLLETFAISLDETTVGRELKALGFAKISARPRHYAQNELAVEAFKKNFPAELAKIRARLPKGVEIELWWQDEARIGQKNKLTRRWARRGTRPRAPRDQRTEWAYIFGAICPAKGKGAGLVMPWCDTDAMAAHLIEISAAVDPGAHAVLIVDQAGWHLTPKLAIPDNITVLALPPRSPELNPVENVWQFMRDNWLSNRIFKSYEDIVALCCQAWNNLIDQPWKIMSLGMRKWAHGF